MKIAILGTGNLGNAIAKGVINSKLKVDSLYLTKRNLVELAAWKNENKVHLTSSNSEAVQQSDIIIIAVQPKQLIEVLNDIKNH